MPRKAAGARLYARPDTGIYYIRDTGRPDRSTSTRNRADAERALSAYIAGKDIVATCRSPDQLPVVEVLDIYGREHAVTVAAPERIGHSIDSLLTFWIGLTVADVKGEVCRRYAKSRVKHRRDGTVEAIADGTVRRELGTLQAAINYCHKEGYLTATTKVTLPPKPPARDRWLTRSEVARLIRAARRTSKGRHLARFILVSIYTGTRKDAVLKLGFTQSASGGWIDVDQGLLYRRGSEERQTNKRRKPVKLPRKLLAHCRRWKASGSRWVVHIDGARVGDIKRAFQGACEHAGLDEIMPHTLKHTAITWGMQRGMKIQTAADYFDTSAETIERVYYHHSPEYQDDAVEAMDRKL
jgi:integrase